ncbi:hypothetical protein ACFYYH_27000 [Streptomyces sp. NPDC002018]|uniref:hypothetical protein n=1 Tax=Streptomyces sp. NPDC002018 TaxID=3364629 RepID=UPI0036958D97
MIRTLAGTVAAVAALGFGLAGPAAVAVAAAPVPVTGLTCDGDTGKCTAALQFGDGKWKARWDATVFHQAERAAAAPVPVTGLTCDGDTGKCTAALQFGDGKWKARWNATVFHQAERAAERAGWAGTGRPGIAAMAAPVPVTGLTCDGDTNKCTASLQFGDGKWKARWDVTVFHQA